MGKMHGCRKRFPFEIVEYLKLKPHIAELNFSLREFGGLVVLKQFGEVFLVGQIVLKLQQGESKL